jgi:acetate kinase
MRILLFNCGSSSAKFGLIELDKERDRRGRSIGRGNFERIGEAHSDAPLVDGGGVETRIADGFRDHGEAALRATEWLDRLTGTNDLALDATEHRRVRVFGPSILDDAVDAELAAAAPFAGAQSAGSGRHPGSEAAPARHTGGSSTDTAFHRE